MKVEIVASVLLLLCNSIECKLKSNYDWIKVV